MAITRSSSAAASSSAKGLLGVWEALGPGNIGGRTRSLLIHPTQHEIMYTAGVSGGVWKTTNGGQYWSPLADEIANIAVNSMVMRPDDPETIYIGTGEAYDDPGQRVAFLDRALDRLGGLAGVDVAGATSHLPASRFGYAAVRLAASRPPPNLAITLWQQVQRACSFGLSGGMRCIEPQQWQALRFSFPIRSMYLLAWN